MFCKNCGKEIDNAAAICVHCGVATNNSAAGMDSGSFGWGLLGCCIPLVGLILYLVWKDTKPKSSKSAGVGALIGVAPIILLYILIFVVGVSSGF